MINLHNNIFLIIISQSLLNVNKFTYHQKKLLKYNVDLYLNKMYNSSINQFFQHNIDLSKLNQEKKYERKHFRFN